MIHTFRTVSIETVLFMSRSILPLVTNHELLITNYCVARHAHLARSFLNTSVDCIPSSPV